MCCTSFLTSTHLAWITKPNPKHRICFSEQLSKFWKVAGGGRCHKVYVGCQHLAGIEHLSSQTVTTWKPSKYKYSWVVLPSVASLFLQNIIPHYLPDFSNYGESSEYFLSLYHIYNWWRYSEVGSSIADNPWVSPKSQDTYVPMGEDWLFYPVTLDIWLPWGLQVVEKLWKFGELLRLFL